MFVCLFVAGYASCLVIDALSSARNFWRHEEEMEVTETGRIRWPCFKILSQH